MHRPEGYISVTRHWFQTYRKLANKIEIPRNFSMLRGIIYFYRLVFYTTGFGGSITVPHFLQVLFSASL